MAGKKVYKDGILFDSEFEANIYELLKPYNPESHPCFKLFDSFQYTDIDNKVHKMRDMEYTGDFKIISSKYDKPIIIECKHRYYY